MRSSIIPLLLLALLPASPARAARCPDFLLRQSLPATRLAVARYRYAVWLAHEAHGLQRYGDKPYSTHLRSVRRVLTRFGFGVDSELGLNLATAAWLHDILEDTPVTYERLERAFGPEIAGMVAAVTNEKPRPGETALEAKRRTFEKIAALRAARILKLADRIANVEEGLKNRAAGKEQKLEKYLAEWPDFKALLYHPGEADALWAHLEALFALAAPR